VVVQACEDAGPGDGSGDVGYVVERCGCVEGCGLWVSILVKGK
jgi:hypothetical protein